MSSANENAKSQQRTMMIDPGVAAGLLRRLRRLAAAAAVAAAVVGNTGAPEIGLVTEIEIVPATAVIMTEGDGIDPAWQQDELDNWKHIWIYEL
mmetsp:Transcript_59724/g.81635  ORF Transcript_59724/g.81635 Transcript_59724/m.81635 type:complete len:94 (+) Transcript_59724:349-630(+)